MTTSAARAASGGGFAQTVVDTGSAPSLGKGLDCAPPIRLTPFVSRKIDRRAKHCPIPRLANSYCDICEFSYTFINCSLSPG